MESKPIVTITGISGYLGSHVCLYFLKSQQFTVRGTVRSKTNAKKIEPLKQAFGEYFDQLQLVEADLLDKESLMKACEGAEYVVHTASPFPVGEPKDPNELIKPAVDGTLAIMEACKVHKVKRCVVTSSLSSVINTNPRRSHFDHTVWSDPDIGSTYEKSKTLAELAAWDYIKALPESEKFELAMINPGYIIGPALIKGEFTSAIMLRLFMLGEMPGCPKIQLACVDVRDCAESHFKALTVPEAAGKRFMLSNECPWFSDIGELLHEKYGKDYKISRGNMPKCMAWMGSFFNREMKALYLLWGMEMNVDNSQTRSVLGIEFSPMKKSFYEMADSLIESGYLPDKRKK